MILHPGALGLLVGGLVVVVMMLVGSALGLRILRRWDPTSSSEEQLELERRTYLVSAMVGVALWIEVGASLLFIHTADDLHVLFVGAMCATGSLNANPVGWWVLASKAAIVLLFPVWLALNHLDQRAGDYPLVRVKYALLLVLLPVAAIDLVLLVAYFRGIHPDIITSCCGSLFAESSDAVTGELAALPAAVTLPLFAVASAVFVGLLLWARVGHRPGSKIAAAATAPVVLGIGITAVISFVSVAYYELPTHHCPFDLFQSANRYVGYPLVVGLLAAVVSGSLPGLFQTLKRRPNLSTLITESERTWLTFALVCYTVFVGVACWPLVFGNLAWDLM